MSPIQLRRPDTQDDLAARSREISIRLTEWPSVTGTRDEAAFSLRLAGFLRSFPYFSARPDQVVVAPIPGDPLGRSNVLALVRGTGTAACVLAGHFDVVPVDDYGDLKPLAFSPEPLREAIVARLEATGENPKALEDLRSGAFLPGRGLLDMKSGLAAGIAVLEAFAADPARQGNLVLVATPDEEDRSAGMRAAADLLPAFLAENGLDARLGVNLDAIQDEHDGAGGRVVTFGCVGKLLLSALVVGKEAHAAYPLAGVNASYLAAEIVAEIELSPELADVSEGQHAAPPTVLGARDLKTGYNVTLPHAAWLTWNVLVHGRKAAEVLDIAHRLTADACERACATMRRRREGTAPIPMTQAWESIPVRSFAEVIEAARARSPEFDPAFKALADELAAQHDLDLPSRSRRLVEMAWSASGLEGPAVVLAFGSMPYPAVHWPAQAVDLRQTIREAMAEVEAEHGLSVGEMAFFPAIADMSFVGPVDGADLVAAAANTPIWGSSIRWDLSRGATPDIPFVNIGPWGRDYHHWLERVDEAYSFGVLPHLVEAVVRKALA
ncbi:M20/M25/M40 family metallo-hydrolase [Salinarimonas soli]|uniref:M20/M25/M40 family metallo-hydrolase n=1 Tax=Salinarimonas soli TaxID=1638099 RepID=A0A5B2VAP0_9HYPH|nr:M20/M25/M40 family metallo-hydrolase [Salinarimonas soli]KAA2235510.1 M20/M25/M40 family metallo-hydrolase [Salinarimonas soli]